jgi:UDP-glucose 4-epimerase
VIIGAGGFIGRALARRLAAAGARVFGVDIIPKHPGLPSQVKYHQADMLDYDQLRRAMDYPAPTGASRLVVFHLAGESHVGRCKAEPRRALALNVIGTLHVLEACHAAGFTRLVFPSSALVYALSAEVPVDEGAPLEARSIYSASKLACEALIRGYSSDFGLVCRVARVGNVYGHREGSDSVVDTVLRQVLAGGPVSVKSLSPVRDFIYRDDVASGLVALATLDPTPPFQVFNLSSGVPTTIRDLASTACRVAGIEADLLETEPFSNGIKDELVLSIAKLETQAGWHPAWTLEDGLRRSLAAMRTQKDD